MRAEKKYYNIYVVLTRTGTKVAKLIRMYTGEPYSHASISFDDELATLYSFARRKLHNPLNAGFIEEHIETGIFGQDKEVGCAVYQLKVTKEQYFRMRSNINMFLRNPLEYGYNFRGLFSAAVNMPYTSPKKFFCSQFVAWVLGSAGINVVSKKYALTRPEDFRKSLEQYKIYEGKLHNYAKARQAVKKQNALYQADYLVM